MEHEKFLSAVEAILFAADRPITIERIKEVFGEEAPADTDVRQLLDGLQQRYADSSHGFELRQAQGGYHFVTKTENAEWVMRFLATKPFRVGKSALETLAIIAYRQPITRAEIDQVRGIDSSHLLRVLIERGLVKMAGKAEVPGRPVQYATTAKFLEVVGLQSTGELPPLSELEQLQGQTEDPMKALNEGLDRFMNESLTNEAILAADQEGLKEIDDLIQTAQRADNEVYASPIHADTARENQAAVAGFQAFFKPQRRRKLADDDTTTVDQPLPEIPEDAPKPEKPQTVN
jgi:segregation and condensation protein B